LQDKTFYSHIIWDWNGTLLDDVNWCIAVINNMLSKRSIKELGNIQEYHRVFCFPIIRYYRNVGLDFEKEPFEELAHEYISLYHSEKSTDYCKLYKNTQYVLKTFQERNKSQVILSASEKSNLISQINLFNIRHYFDEILGLSNVYAESKLDVGINYIKQNRINKAILIGDTEHDCEVAKKIDIDCLLIANGHQSKDKLLLCNVPVLDNILEVIEYIQ
jgi:phosphoglycolate phosphatase